MFGCQAWLVFSLLCSLLWTVHAVEELASTRNGKRRVDDTDELLVYTPADSWLSCRAGVEGCNTSSANISGLHNGTWHELTRKEGQMQFNFIGSEVILYAATGDGTFDSTRGLKFQVDGVSYPATLGTFQASNLDGSNHTLVLSASLLGSIRLDYLAYSYSENSTHPSSAAASSQQDKQKKQTVIAAILGTILPLLAIASLVIGYIWLRRRRRRKKREGRAKSFDPTALVKRQRRGDNRRTIDHPTPFEDHSGEANIDTTNESRDQPLSPNRLHDVENPPPLPAVPPQAAVANKRERIQQWRSDLLAEPSFLHAPSTNSNHNIPPIDHPARIPTLLPTPLLTPYTPARPPLTTAVSAPIPPAHPPLITGLSELRPLPPGPSIDTSNVRPTAVRAITTPILQQQSVPQNPSRPRGPRRFTVMNN